MSQPIIKEFDHGDNRKDKCRQQPSKEKDDAYHPGLRKREIGFILLGSLKVAVSEIDRDMDSYIPLYIYSHNFSYGWQGMSLSMFGNQQA